MSNDYVVRFENQFYQLLPPVYPGERGGRVVLEVRRDGSVAIRFGRHDLSYERIGDRRRGRAGGSRERITRGVSVW